MADKQSLSQRLEDFRPTKTLLFWSCAGCVLATLIVGFSWGGWVTGGTAQEMTSRAAADARSELAAAICVHRFANSADVSATLASLKKADSWKRDRFIEEGGWATLPGVKEPVAGAAGLCAEQLLDAKLPLAKAAGKSG